MGMVLKDTSLWVFTLPALVGSDRLLDLYVVASLLLAFVSVGILGWALSPGGSAWREGRARVGRVAIPGVRGLPVLGSLLTLSGGLAHRSLAAAAWSKADRRQLMAFSLGQTPAVVASDPIMAREVLTSPHFADRPLKQSARSLMFGRAIGFAPNGTYWRLLRRISASHLFSPKRISAHEPSRQLDCTRMIKDIATEQVALGHVPLRKHLQLAALSNIMGSVFGKRYDPSLDGPEMNELTWMVREGFELLGAFNWSDHLPWLSYIYEPHRISERCTKLVPRVRSFVRAIVDEHRARMGSENLSDDSDFVDVLLSLGGDEKLDEDDMVAVLWEMIFRGTDTTALLTEWVMAELVLHPEVQRRLQTDLDCAALGNCTLTDSDVAKLPYLQAVVKETLRLHPPGPLLSWARLSTSDVNLSNGMVVPAQTTAMVNMWAITHDAAVWPDPLNFNPDRFMEADVDVRGGDLRLAPFGAGRRVCPGKNLGLVSVTRWVAELAYRFEWVAEPGYPVDLSEVLKLSCEMKHPLQAIALPRNN